MTTTETITAVETAMGYIDVPLVIILAGGLVLGLVTAAVRLLADAFRSVSRRVP